MKYAIHLSDDSRILFVTSEEYAREGAVLVDALPEGNRTDYRYIDGEFVYDPLDKRSVSPRNLVAGEYITVDGTLYKVTTNIPSGEPIVTGQNAIETTVEEQLMELSKGE